VCASTGRYNPAKSSYPTDEHRYRQIKSLKYYHFGQSNVLRTAGYPSDVPNEYDLWIFGHQAPGGMTGTLKNQFAYSRQ
jgi:hypothetical protein